MCVCVCVCVREREREGECVRVYSRVNPVNSFRRTRAELGLQTDGSVKLRLDLARRVPAGETGNEDEEKNENDNKKEKNGGFSVEPARATIAPGKEARFCVTFTPPTAGGARCLYIHMYVYKFIIYHIVMIQRRAGTRDNRAW